MTARHHISDAAMSERRHGLHVTRRRIVILLTCFVLALLSLALEKPYRTWLFKHAERIKIVVYCDTTQFGQDLQAVVYYDDLALRFLPRALGLFQNRPAAQVKTYYPYKSRPGFKNDYSIELDEVPYGPLVRIVFVSEGKKIWVEVPERRVYQGKMSVWPQ